MVVISIIVILLSLAIPNYQSSILHAQETALREDLYTMRSLIDQYTLDKQKAPQSLQDLVDAGYLKQLPKDPFTNSRDTLGSGDGREHHVARPDRAGHHRRAQRQRSDVQRRHRVQHVVTNNLKAFEAYRTLFQAFENSR